MAPSQQDVERAQQVLLEHGLEIRRSIVGEGAVKSTLEASEYVPPPVALPTLSPNSLAPSTFSVPTCKSLPTHPSPQLPSPNAILRDPILLGLHLVPSLPLAPGPVTAQHSHAMCAEQVDGAGGPCEGRSGERMYRGGD